MPSSNTPYTLAGFIALPVELRVQALAKSVKHYIYIKAYDPKTPDEESPRSLFLVNIPVTSNEAQLRHLLNTQIGAAHVQNVHFADSSLGVASGSSALIATTKPMKQDLSQSLGKRKRPQQETSKDIRRKLEIQKLPNTRPGDFHVSGSTAIAVFLDQKSRDLTLRAIQKTAKAIASRKVDSIVWSKGLENSKTPTLGLARYQAEKELTFPSRAALLGLVDEYMTTYAQLEQSQSAESAKKRAEPDEDGFITVTRGSKGVVKNEEAEAIKSKLAAKKRKDGLEDFYRFQMREKRKEEAGKLMKKFEADRKTVRDLNERRGKPRPGT